MALAFIEGHSFRGNKNKSGVHFLAKWIDLDEIQSVATTCWFVEAHANVILHK